MNWYALSALLNFTASVSFGVFTYCKNRNGPVNRSYGLLSGGIAFWSLSYFLWQIAQEHSTAFFWVRLLSVGAIFIPIFYLHFILSLLNKQYVRRKVLQLGYLISFILVPVVFSHLFIKGVRQKLFFPYWPDADRLYIVFLLFFFLCVIYAVCLMFKVYHESVGLGLRREQIKYVIIASLVGFLGGSTNYPLWFDINILPVGNVFVAFHVAILAYAIVKYRLMDITVTITRTGVFVAIYTLVLGVPFIMAMTAREWFINFLGERWWMGPMVLMATLAVAGPFLYIFFQKKAEAILLREQRQYQEALKEIALGMTRIRNLRKLLDLMANIFIKTVRIAHFAVYLFDKKAGGFILKLGRNVSDTQPPSVSDERPLVIWFRQNRQPLVYEEVKRKAQENPPLFAKLEEDMRLLNAAVIVPSFLEDKLSNFMVLGHKCSDKIYTSEDLSVFSVLASQVALAIENALLYENIEKQVRQRTEELVDVQKQLVQAEKLATVGTLAGGVAHEINNPLMAILTNAQMLLTSDTIKDESDRESLELIEEATQRCRVIVKKLMTYARKPLESDEVDTVDLLEVVKKVVAFLEYQLEQENIKIIIDARKDSYPVLGQNNELEQVITNIVLNAKDAVRRVKESGSIHISVSKDRKSVSVAIKDEGAGVPDEVRANIFDPFFTTKDIGKGLGLGLSICQAIIERHKGKITVESVKDTGATFTVTLPGADEKIGAQG